MDLQNLQRKSQIIKLYQEHNDLLLQLVEILKRDMRSRPVKRDTADDTMYELGKVEGGCEALDSLMRDIEQLAHG